MYTLTDGTPVIIESRHVVTNAESDYYGQEIVQVLCQGERDWMPATELIETRAERKAMASGPSKTMAVARPQRQSSAMSCHYCGMDAYTFGFFDEPVCRECGG